jgi:ABC-type glycerol-3-phosphate transport system substrate-binding protein
MRTPQVVAVVFICWLFGASLFAHAGGKAEPPAELVTLRQWVFPGGDLPTDEAIFTAVLRELQKERPEIRVATESYPPGGRLERMLVAAAANASPDVAPMADHMRGYLAPFVVDLRASLGDVAREAFFASAVAAAEYRGAVVFLPVLVDPAGTFANLELLAQAGVAPAWIDESRTWEELVRVCEAMEDAGHPAFALGPQTNRRIDAFSQWLHQAGGSFYDAELTRCALDTAEAVAAVELYARLVGNYVRPSDRFRNPAEAAKRFVSGEAAFSTGRFATILAARDGATRPEIRMTTPTRNRREAAGGTVAGYAVFSQTALPEAAAAWVGALAGTVATRLAGEATGLVPARRPVAEEVAAERKDPLFHGAVLNARRLVPTIPASPVAYDAAEAVASVLLELIAGEHSPGEAAKEMTRRIDALLAEANAGGQGR